VIDSERELVRRVIAGDESAFDALFEDQFPRLFRFVLLRVRGDEDLAEEVVQAVMLDAMTKLAKWSGEGTLFSWLCTFCRHELSATIKGVARRNEVELTEDSLDMRASLKTLVSDGDASPEVAAQKNEIRRLIHATLDELPYRYGDVLEWKYIEELSVNEIAGRLKIGPKAAESMMTRARKMFRSAFTTHTGREAVGKGLVPTRGGGG
jgi:RNA polymerase sigma-70 factor (ECF subfamily)